MNEKTRELILLNCESYEFFQKELLSLEEQYFDWLEQLLAACGNITDMMFSPKEYMNDEIIINKLKHLRSYGEKYIAISCKFEREMQQMLKLAPNFSDDEIEFDGVKNKFLFVSDYIEEIEQSLMLQLKMRSCIEKQLKLFKGFEKYE